MNITLDNQQITIDGQPAGTYDGTDYVPAEGMKKAQVNAVAKFLRGIAETDQTPPEFTVEKVKAAQAILRSCPIPQDPALGDKTPEVVEWYRDNDPEEFARRYRGRKTHLGRIG